MRNFPYKIFLYTTAVFAVVGGAILLQDGQVLLGLSMLLFAVLTALFAYLEVYKE